MQQTPDCQYKPILGQIVILLFGSFERRCVDSAKIHVDVCDAALRHGQLMETFKSF